MIQLMDDRLGTLALRRAPFTVASFQIGTRSPRVVMRNRALADGGKDDTRFAGGRAITLALVLNGDECAAPLATMQALYDAILPYTVARRRPTLRWSLPGSSDERECIVRCDDAPVVIEGPRHPALVMSFTAAEGEITSPYNAEVDCTDIEPAVDVEVGRTYNMTYNRTFPSSQAVGDRLVNQGGNERAHWTGVIFAGDGTTDPYLRINSVTVSFSGLVLPGGAAVVIDTRERTMWLNGVVGDSVFGLSNFTQWAWEDLMMEAGSNALRFGATVLGTGAVMQLCHPRTWVG